MLIGIMCVSILFSEDLQVSSTKYFDIIYDAEVSSESAALLTEYADGYVTEICEKLSLKPFTSRMPVYLNAGTDLINGLYVPSPFPHIFIHDTPNIDNAVSNLTDTILGVFYHELTHALTVGGFYYLNTSSMIEGVATAMESMNGEGRLNNPIFLYYMIQNKIDGTNPTWADTSGFIDNYPRGIHYLYGAAFNKYLMDTYGMEKYAKLWQAWNKSATNLSFKKKFGKSRTEIWNDFISSIKVPESEHSKSLFNHVHKGLYETMASSKDYLAVLDSNSKKVYLYDKNNKYNRSFRVASAYSITFSADGKYLLVSDFAMKHGMPKNRVLIYDVENKKFLREKYIALRYACLSADNSKIYAIETKSQFSSLVEIDRKTGKRKIILKAGPGLKYSVLYNVVNAGDLGIALLAGNALSRDILFINPNTLNIQKLKIDKKLSGITSLQANNVDGHTVLSFSWLNKDMLPRLASYNTVTKELLLLNKNISGGTYSPVYHKLKNKNIIATVGKYAKYDTLNYVNLDSLETVKTSLLDENKNVANAETTENAEKKIVSKRAKLNLLNAHKYNPIMKMYIPKTSPFFEMAPNWKDFQKHTYGLNFSGIDPIGRLSYSITAGFKVIPFFAHFDFIGTMKSGAAENSILFRENAIYNDAGDVLHKTGFGFKNSTNLLAGVLQDKINLASSINFDWFGKFDPADKSVTAIYNQKYTDTIMSLDTSLSYSHFVRKIRFGNSFFAEDMYGIGIKLNPSFGFNFQNKKSATQFQVQSIFKTPVVPLTTKLSGYIGYNSVLEPLVARYSLFQTSGVLNVDSLLPKMNAYKKMPSHAPAQALNGAFGLDTSLRIFSVEIQKGIAMASVNRFNIDAGYKSVLMFYDAPNKNKPTYLQAAYVQMTADVMGLNLGLSYSHPIISGNNLGAFGLVFNQKF